MSSPLVMAVAVRASTKIVPLIRNGRRARWKHLGRRVVLVREAAFYSWGAVFKPRDIPAGVDR